MNCDCLHKDIADDIWLMHGYFPVLSDCPTLCWCGGTGTCCWRCCSHSDIREPSRLRHSVLVLQGTESFLNQQQALPLLVSWPVMSQELSSKLAFLTFTLLSAFQVMIDYPKYACHHQIHLWFEKTAGLRWNQRDQHFARSMSLSHSADADVESSERRRYARHAYVVSTVDSQEDVAIFWDPGMSLRHSATIWMPIRS